MNLPNSLTVLRIFLIPLLIVVLLTRIPSKEFIGVAIFLAAALTDWADGYVARRRREITTFGTWLDPVADKLLVTSAFIALVEMQLAPAWIVVIIVGRELAVTGLRNVALAKGFSIDVSELGKVKMAVQVFTITALILGIRFSLLEALGRWALWLTVFLALVSAVQYFRRFWMQMGVPVPERRAGPEPALSGAEGSEVEGRSRGVREPLLHFTEQPKGDVPTHH
ncbi:MAG: CDP-diacylglycerol--glycerol-3-phosphate 3-phosphatidyltransferase [Acidobacteria bacterium RIFCSPLOWO2_12_FULL_60_22]|nr:MAG: CDP-diacylglycerol--glycerol-3-phosphate 3-phosphatidyltransferase [Acidobacteria bacterium RIFCSPLOWO2_12_FULL_60_22]